MKLQTCLFITGFFKDARKTMCSTLNQQPSINNILATEQCGFRKDRSIEHAVYTLINRLLQVWNSKLQVFGIFCDLAKAFVLISTWISFGASAFYYLYK